MSVDSACFVVEERKKAITKCSGIKKSLYISGKVIPNFSSHGENRKSYQHPRDNKRKICFLDSPLMLLPRAQIRENYSVNNINRLVTVIPDDGLQDIQLSTISVSDWMEKTLLNKSFSKNADIRSEFDGRITRPNTASNLRSRVSISDSGYSSMKRSVTFENITHVYRSPVESNDYYTGTPTPSPVPTDHKPDEYHSELAVHDCDDNYDDSDDDYGVDNEKRYDNLPVYFDTYGDDKPVFNDSRSSTRTDLLDQTNTSEKELALNSGTWSRVDRYFGDTKALIDWIFLQWHKLRRKSKDETAEEDSLVYIQPSYNSFVKSAVLHNRSPDGSKRYTPDEYLAHIKHASKSSARGKSKKKGKKGGRYGVISSASSGSSVEEEGGRRWGDLDAGGPGAGFGKGSGAAGRPQSGKRRGKGKGKGKGSGKGSGAAQEWAKRNSSAGGYPRLTVTGRGSVDNKMIPGWKSADSRRGSVQVAGGGYRFSRGSISGRGSVDKGHKIRDCRKSSAASSADHSLKENEGILDEKEEKGESAKGKKKEKSTSKKKEVMRYSLSGPTSYRRRGSAISGYEFGGSPGSYEIEDFELENQERNLANMKQHQRKVSSWIDYRLALSQQSSRFTLPMDMKQLETMTPVQYLLKHCVVSPRRANLYHKVFYRVKNNKTGLISVNDLEKGLKDVLIHTITEEHINELKDILKITEETVIDYKLFGGIAAFAERMLYHQFVTDETIDLPQFQKDKIECADFSALEWKLHGINIKPTMKQILNILGS